jgi:hypothetical protein
MWIEGENDRRGNNPTYSQYIHKTHYAHTMQAYYAHNAHIHMHSLSLAAWRDIRREREREREEEEEEEEEMNECSQTSVVVFRSILPLSANQQNSLLLNNTPSRIRQDFRLRPSLHSQLVLMISTQRSDKGGGTHGTQAGSFMSHVSCTHVWLGAGTAETHVQLLTSAWPSRLHSPLLAHRALFY